MTSLVTALTVSILCMAHVLAQAQSSLVGPDGQPLGPWELELGDCLGDGKAVDLSEVLFISNQSLREKRETGFDLIRIDGQKLLIERHASNRRQYDYLSPHDIAFFVANGGEYPDLELSFIELDGQKALFWKETYKQRSYRQGILKFAEQKRVKVCEGRGGIDADD